MTTRTIRTDEATARTAFENGVLVDAMPAAIVRSTYKSEGLAKGDGGLDTWEQFIALARTGLIPEAELAFFVVEDDTIFPMERDEVLREAIARLERCRIIGKPGKIDEELADLRSENPDIAHAARILGVRVEVKADRSSTFNV